jgi:uncharacterized protein YukE
MRDNLGSSSFPALGFDPAPGSPAALLAQAREAERAGRSLAGAAAAAGRLDAGWQGDSADAFRAEARDLPRDLRHAAEAHGTLARELTTYADELAERQLRAADLERRAAALRRAARETAGVRSDATGPDAGAPPPTPSALRAASAPLPATSALRAVGAGSGSAYGAGSAYGGRTVVEDADGGGAELFGGELAAVLADAARLRAEHRTAAARASARIRAATDPPYREPGRLDRIRGQVTGWVARHADVLTSISRDLRGISATLGVVSLVPGFQFLAPLAGATGALAVAIDAAVAFSTGRGSWPALLADAALTVLPTGPVARAVRTVPGVTRALKAANRAVPPAVRGRLFRTVRNLPEGITADQLTAAATRIRSGTRGLTDDVVVQGSRAGHSARAGSDVDFGLRVPPERYDELIRECFGDAPVREAATNAIERGRIFWRHAGLKELHDALQTDLGRKVDLAIIKRGGRFDGEPWLPVR